jgi:hypothetical protein
VTLSFFELRHARTHSTMWGQLGGGCALLIGTKQPLLLDYQKLKTHFVEGRVQQDMALSQVRDVDHLQPVAPR